MYHRSHKSGSFLPTTENLRSGSASATVRRGTLPPRQQLLPPELPRLPAALSQPDTRRQKNICKKQLYMFFLKKIKKSYTNSFDENALPPDFMRKYESWQRRQQRSRQHPQVPFPLLMFEFELKRHRLNVVI